MTPSMACSAGSAAATSVVLSFGNPMTFAEPPLSWMASSTGWPGESRCGKLERKSEAEGKSVSVSVDLGGGGIIKKTQYLNSSTTRKTAHTQSGNSRIKTKTF